MEHLKEKISIWIAWALPKRIAYWAAIRVGVNASTGKWSHVEVPGITIVDMLQRWEY